MKKADLMETIKLGYNEKIKPVLALCGINVDIRPSGNRAKLENCLKWIGEFKEKEINDFLHLYKQTTPEMWKSFEVFEMNDLDEMIMLNKLKKRVKEAWKKRPSSIIRTYHNDVP